MVWLWSFRNEFIPRLQLHHSEDMSVLVSTWTSYYFNALTPVVLKLWRF